MKRITLLTLCAAFFLGGVFVNSAYAQSGSDVEQTARVKNVRKVAKTKKSITIRWKDQPRAQQYQVRVLHKGKTMRKVKTAAHKKKIKKLKAGKRYTFQVRSRPSKNVAWGRWSKKRRIRTRAAVQEHTGIPFGYWGLNGYLSEEGLTYMKETYGITTFQVASSAPNYTVNTLLPLVRDAGLTVTLRMSGGHVTFTTDEGDFDLAQWKENLSVWEDSGVDEFIADGTLAGHMILDDIDTFDGYNPDAADLEEMARYSKQVMPGLTTFVRHTATNMPEPANGKYQYVDAVVNQYRSWDGDAATYVTAQRVRAQELGVDTIFGMNIADGGDGSSGQRGWRADKYAMSAGEIVEYGSALLAGKGLTSFLMWELDAQEEWSDGETIGAEYFGTIEMQAALNVLAQLAAEYQ